MYFRFNIENYIYLFNRELTFSKAFFRKYKFQIYESVIQMGSLRTNREKNIISSDFFFFQVHLVFFFPLQKINIFSKTFIKHIIYK